ncbi:MAG TPA: hypothetical protein PJ982_10770, partial [Lacipirellulaceae bacterium]|nr:hypothetical protein [Lacipirellulaceae bacterium]
MNLALLGDDAESSILARAAEAAGHAIVWREAAAPDEWETLLDASTADAILVGPADGAAADLRARQMVELARQGRPLLAVHPVVPSVLSYFEIDLARGDGGAPLQHYNPTAELAGADELQRWIGEGHPTAGPVEQVVATRRLAQRARGEVLRWFARDVELLARLVGRCPFKVLVRVLDH